MENGLTRQDLLRLAGGMSLATVLSGCGFGIGTSRASSAGATLWETSTGVEQQIVKRRTQRFNTNHNASTVQVQFFQSDPYKTKLRIAMGANNPPDMLYSWGGGSLESYVDVGKLYDLTSVFKQDPGWWSNIRSSVMPPVTFDKKIYGIPMSGTSPVVFFYNKDMFARYGLSPPSTWGGLLRLVQRIKDRGIIPLTLGGLNRWPAQYYTTFLVDRIGGPSVFEAVLNGKPGAWSQPAMLKAFAMTQHLVRMGPFQDGYMATSYDTGQASALMYEERSAMHLMGGFEYTQNLVNNAPEFIRQDKLGWFRFPAVKGGSGHPANLVGGAPNYYSISRAAGDKATRTSLSYLKDGLFQEEEIQAWLDIGEVLPLHGMEGRIRQQDHHREWLLDVHRFVEEAHNIQLPWDQALQPEAAETFLSNIAQLFALEIGPQQFARNMNDTIKQ